MPSKRRLVAQNLLSKDRPCSAVSYLKAVKDVDMKIVHYYPYQIVLLVIFTHNRINKKAKLT